MSKILRGLLIVCACVVGLSLQPCRADEPASTYDPDSLVYVPLVLDQSWNGNSVVVESSPQGIAMHKVTRVLYYLNSESQELEQFTRLEQLPRYLPMYKFEGFYTEPNGAGTKIIDYAGSPVESGVNALPTENYGGYILLYPNFVALTQLKLNTNGGIGGTAFLYFLRHTIDNDLCGVWLNEYGEERNEVSIEKPEREGYFFDGYHISRNATSTQWIGKDGNISDIRQIVCENIFLLRENTLYAAWSQCAEGQYKSGEECLPCPADNINVGENELYKFVTSSGTGIAGCRIKLNTDKSNCAEGTDVIYTYNTDTGKYENQKSTIVLGAGVYITKLDNVFRDSEDYCGSCAIGGGKYVDNKGFCRDCPTETTTGCLNCGEGNIGNDNLYNFVEGTGSGLSSCTIKLNKTNCGDGTVVKYVYDSSIGKYIRQNGYIIKEENAPVKTGTDFPKEDELTDYCVDICPPGKYYINGSCDYCSNGYYLKDGKCTMCPAGYACPKTNANIFKPSNMDSVERCDPNLERDFCACDKGYFSVAGASECTKCASGYTTKYSSPDTDGLCLVIGEKCVSPDACKPLTDAKLCFDTTCSSSVTIGEGTVKIISTNQSVVREK